MKDDTRLALLEQSIIHINETMIRLEKKIDSGFDKVNSEMRESHNLQWSQFRWMIVFITGSVGTIIGVLSKVHF